MTVEPKFTWVLKSLKGGLYKLDTVYDDEIVWRRGYRICNIYEYVVGNTMYTLYSFGPGHAAHSDNKTRVRSRAQFYRWLRRYVECQILAIFVGGNMVNITYEHTSTLSGNGRFTEDGCTAKLKKMVSKYDEFAPSAKTTCTEQLVLNADAMPNAAIAQAPVPAEVVQPMAEPDCDNDSEERDHSDSGENDCDDQCCNNGDDSE